MSDFPFTDLHSFKDYVSVIRMCAPDEFPVREGSGEQWTLGLAFKGLEYGLNLIAIEKGEMPVLEICRGIAKEAYAHYIAGHVPEGCSKMREIERLIKKLPSQ